MPNDAVAPVKTPPAAVDLRGTATFNFQKTYDASEGSELRTAISAALCDGDGGYCSEDSSDGGRCAPRRPCSFAIPSAPAATIALPLLRRYRLTLVRFVVRAEHKDSGKWVEVGEAQVCLGAMFEQCEMAEDLEDPEMDPRNGCPQWLKVQGEGDGLKEWGQGMFTSEPSGALLGVVNAMPVLEAIRKALQEGDADSESDAPSSQPSQSVSLPSCFLESSFRSKAEYEASLLLPDAERAAAEAAARRGLMPSAPPLRLPPDGGGDGGGGDDGGRGEGGDEGGGGEGDGGDGRGGDRGGRVEGGEDDGSGEGGDGGPDTICGELKPKDKVYFIGKNLTLPNGNKLRHGQQGEVVRQGAFPGDVEVLFPGNRDNVEVLLGLVRASHAVPPPALPPATDTTTPPSVVLSN